MHTIELTVFYIMANENKTTVNDVAKTTIFTVVLFYFTKKISETSNCLYHNKSCDAIKVLTKQQLRYKIKLLVGSEVR